MGLPDRFWVCYRSVAETSGGGSGLLNLNWLEPDGIMRSTEDNSQCLNSRHAVACFYTEEQCQSWVDAWNAKVLCEPFWADTAVDVSVEEALRLAQPSQRTFAMVDEDRPPDSQMPPLIIYEHPIEVISKTVTQVGGVEVTFTIGRVHPRK